MTTARALSPGFLRDERGGVLPMVALSLIVLLGFAALAIDLGQQYALSAQLETTADAAALAAASRLPNQAKAVKAAAEYAELNMPEKRHGIVLNEDDIVFGTWTGSRFDPEGEVINAVQVTVRRSAANGNAAPTFFLHIFGHDHADLSAQAVAGVVFHDPGPPGAEPSAEERQRREEMLERLSEEQRRRYKKYGHDPDEQMTAQEIFEFLREDYGRAVLLR